MLIFFMRRKMAFFPTVQASYCSEVKWEHRQKVGDQKLESEAMFTGQFPNEVCGETAKRRGGYSDFPTHRC